MTRRVFLDHLLEEHGIDIPFYRVDYLVAAGRIPRPSLDARGHRVYTAKHAEAVAATLARRAAG